MNGTARNWLAGTIALAAVVWFALPRPAAGQPPGNDYQTMKSRNLAFDLNVDADQKNTIHSIELYVSREDGGVWELGATATPDAKSIPYAAKEDGIYLVNMVIVYKSGVRDPADVTKSAPLQKLLVDSAAPVLKFTTAEKRGDDVHVAWNIEDRNPAHSKTKLDWKPVGESDLAWKSVAIEKDRRTASFKPGGTTGVIVRVTAEDLAGNATVQTKEIAGTSTSTSFAPSTVLPAPDLKLPGGEAGIVLPAFSPAPKTLATPTLDLTKAPAPSIVPPTMPAPLTAPSLTGAAPIASSSVTPPAAAVETSNIKAVNYLKFDLPYELEAGPSGISKIELYVTRDDGKSWGRWSVHDGEQRPLRVALDTRANVQPEGLYGFRLVPISGAGISDHPPAEGSAPDFRVLVDLTPPTIKVYAPDADAAQPGSLTLKWKIEDKNPAKDGVAIAWSETPAGPWKSIGESSTAIVAGAGTDNPIRLADTGSFAWKLPEKVPAKVYLRMTAWDAAGNKSEVTTPNPVLVDLTKPKARIQGIVPAGSVSRILPSDRDR